MQKRQKAVMARCKKAPVKTVLALALEQRFMFDAAGVATGAEIAKEAAAKEAADQAGEMDKATPPENNARKDLVLIDSNVSDSDILAAGIPDNAEVVHLGPGTTLDDIANLLSNYQNIDGLHIISHGGESSLNLSGQTITSSNLADNKTALNIIGQSLSANGDILLYGCNIGAEGSGQAFIADFAEYTGADIAASDDLTGAASLGGDWDLETHVGLVDSRVIVDSTTVQNYAGVLAISNENFDSVGLINVNASSRTIGDWTFSMDVTDLIATPNAAEQAQNLNSDGGGGDRSLVLNNASIVFRTLTIASADDSEFDISSMAFGLVNGGTATGVSIEGFRDNVSVVSSESVNITSSDSAGNVHYSFSATTAGGSYGTLTFQSAFDNVDEIRITANNIAIMELDDIVATAAVTNSAPDLGGTPADDTATEDVATAIDLSAYNISDADGDTITLTLAVDRGTIASIDGNGTTAGVTVGTSGTSSMTLQGTVANLNTYLNDTSKITYTTASNDTTTATLTVTPNDGTVNGTADTVDITISAVNDNPTASTVPSDVTVTEDTQSNIDLSTISFADVDSASITVTLTASAGTFATPSDGAGVGGGVTETLQSATVITLVGAPSDINTYLDTASNIQYTAASNVSGGNVATITVTANDGDGSGNVNLGTVNIDVTAVNDNPAVATLPASVTVTEDTQSNIALGATVFSDVDSASITVTLTASAGTFATPADGAGVGGGVTETLQSATVITLVGAPADINTYLDTASNIQYTPASNVSGNAAATITVTANDGDGSGNVAMGTVNVNVTAVNDDPTISSLPASVTVTEDTQSNVALGAASFADVDGDTITVTLTASAGTFATPADGAGVGGGVTETLQSATVITLVGAPADINTYLDTASNIQYTAASNVSGNAAATITVVANDGAGSGDVNLGTVNVNVTAVNDNPAVATLPASVTVTEDTQSNIGLGATVFSDVDSASITVTLTASAGTFATPADGAGVGGGVTETLQSATVITLVGAPADINTYLDTASNIQYTPASNVSGNAAATITVTANDGDGSGNVAMGTVNVNVTAVNDDPTISSLPASVTVTEDTQSNVALGAASFADVDGDTITVTLTASAGTFATPAEGAGVGGGVTETLQSATVITLVGAAADINTYLDTASNIQYTAASNVSGNAAATITVVANDGAGSGDVNLGTVNIDVTAVNDLPVFTGLNGAPAFTEDGSAQILDSDVTVADVELGSLGGSGNFNGATLVLARNGGVNTNDTFSIQSGGNLTVAGSNISAGGNIFATFDTASVSGQVTVSFTSANGTTPTTALVNEVMQAIRYANGSNDPAAAPQINWTFSDGNSGNAQGTGDNPGTTTGSTTVTVTNVNDAPTLTATGGNPTFTEGGAAQDLFNTVTASTIETVDRFTTLQLTVTNVSDGSSEILSFDGSDVALTNGNAVTTATNGLSVSVSVTGSTATVSFTGATLTNAQMQTLVDGLTYRNTSETPTTAGNRVVTITSIADNGGTANSGVATAAPNLTSTVTVAAVNDTPTLTGFGPDAGNVGYTSGATTFVAFDSGTVANLQDAELDALNSGSGNYNGATITLVRNGGANTTDRFGIAGGTTALDNGSTVTVGGTNVGTVTSGSAASGTITITLNTSATSALVDTFFQSIGYTNTNGAATGTVTIDVTLNDGNTGSQGSGGAQSVTEQVNVTIGNIPVIGNLTGDVAAFTENAGAVVIDQGSNATVTDVDSPANLNGGNLSLSVTGNANAVQDVLSFSTAGTVALGGTTAGSNVSVGGVVIGTLANNIAAGNTLQVNLNSNATTANVQTLVQAATYNNTSEEPTTGNRTISVVVTDDTGLTSTAATATVSIASVNDAPTLTATGSNPTFTEGGAASDLFNTITASTIETADRFTTLQLTVTNVSDGASEILSFDGSDVALTNGNSVNTATNALSVSVAVAGNTATVSFTGATLTNAQMQTLVDGLTYRNTSDAPSAGANRVVTITSIGDNGGTANGGVATTALNLVSTVTVAAVNDAPTLTNFGPDTGNVGYTVSSTTFVAFDSGTVANLQDAELDALNTGAGNYNGATITLVRNGGADATDRFGMAGGTAALDNGSTVTVGGTNIGTVTAGNATSGTITMTLNNNATSALVDTFFRSIGYLNTNGAAAGSVTIDITVNDGNTGAQGSGGALSVTDSVTIDIQPVPALTSATYNATTGTLVVTGEGIVANTAGFDIDASTVTLTGEGGETYTLTNTSDVNRDSSTQFTLVLSAADKAALNQILNKNGVSATDSTNFNIAVADNWVTGAPTALDISDTTAAVTVSGVVVPTITSSTYNADTGVLVITGSGFLKSAGANNDIDVSKLSIRGLSGSVYTLTNTADVDISSGTSATITLSAADKAAVNRLLDANGSRASDAAVYNLAATEDWAKGANPAVNIADLAGNSITVSSVTETTPVTTSTPITLNLQQIRQQIQQEVQQPQNEPVQTVLLDTTPGDSGLNDLGGVNGQTTVGLIRNEGQGVTSGNIASDPSAGIDALTIVRDTVVGGASGQNVDIVPINTDNPLTSSSPTSDNSNLPSRPVNFGDVLTTFGTPVTPGGDQVVPSGEQQPISQGDQQGSSDEDEDDGKGNNIPQSVDGNTQGAGSASDNSETKDPATEKTRETGSEPNPQSIFFQSPQLFSDQLAQARGEYGERIIQALKSKT